jgi:hypothetical protein
MLLVVPRPALYLKPVYFLELFRRTARRNEDRVREHMMAKLYLMVRRACGKYLVMAMLLEEGGRSGDRGVDAEDLGPSVMLEGRVSCKSP